MLSDDSYVINPISDGFEEELKDAFLQACFVRVELDVLLPLDSFAHGGLDATELFVLQTLSKLRELLRNEVGGRILRKAVGHTEGEAAVILKPGSHLGIERIEEDALTVHAAEVGTVRHRHAGTDEMQGLVTVERHIGPLDQDGVCRGEVIVHMHGHAADQVVQDRDGVHVDGIIVVDGDIVQKAGDRLDAVAAAVLAAGAVGVGQTELLKDGTGFLAADTEAADLTHGVAVQLQRRPDTGRFVLDHQEEDVGLEVVEEVALHKGRGIVRELVDAEDEAGLDPVAQAIPASVIIELQGLGGGDFGRGNGLGLAGLFLFFEIRNRKQPSADHRDEDHGDQQSSACVFIVSAQRGLCSGGGDDLGGDAEDGGLVQNEGDGAVIVHGHVHLDPLAIDKHHQADKVVGILKGDGDGGRISRGNSTEGLAGDNKRAVFGRGLDVGRDGGVFVLTEGGLGVNECIDQLFEVGLHGSVGIAGELAESDNTVFGKGIRNGLDCSGLGPRGVSLGSCLRVCFGGIADPVSTVAAGVLGGARCRKGERRDAGEHQDNEQCREKLFHGRSPSFHPHPRIFYWDKMYLQNSILCCCCQDQEALVIVLAGVGGEDEEFCAVRDGRGAVILTGHDMIAEPVADECAAVVLVGAQQVGIRKGAGTEHAVAQGFGGGVDNDGSKLFEGSVLGIAVLEVGELPLIRAVEDRDGIVHVVAVVGALAEDGGAGILAVGGMGLVEAVLALAAENGFVHFGTGDGQPGDNIGVHGLERRKVRGRAVLHGFRGLGERVSCLIAACRQDQAEQA